MSEQPNIIFIICDQWRGDCLSVDGHPTLETPNLDSLARQGCRFSRAYSSSPSCIAARAALFTGMSPFQTGRSGYRDKVPWNYSRMLPQVLAEAGYQTHCSGKTHFYPQRKHCGFQSHESYEGSQNLDGRYVNDYREWLRDKTGGEFEEWDHGLNDNSWMCRPSQLPEHLHNNWWTMSRAIDFLRRRDRTRPYFLNISFHRPHPPIDPPQRYYDMYRDRPLAEVPVGDWRGEVEPVDAMATSGGVLPQSMLDHSRRGYYAQLAHIDNMIGRLLVSFRNLQEEEPWIIFTSDHGELLGDHHHFCKSLPYEGSARIPLIIKPPKQAGIPGVGCVSTPAVIEDLYPTILQMAGLEADSRLDSHSLLPVFEKQGAGLQRELAHAEHGAPSREYNFWHMLSDGRYKYIWWIADDREMLFDLEEDPGETRDLSQKQPDLCRSWRQRLAAYLHEKQDYDGLSDGETLKPGRKVELYKPWAEVGLMDYDG